MPYKEGLPTRQSLEILRSPQAAFRSEGKESREEFHPAMDSSWEPFGYKSEAEPTLSSKSSWKQTDSFSTSLLL